MSSNVEQEELDAILSIVGSGQRGGPPREVASRDFRRPRRLAPERREDLLRLVRSALGESLESVAGVLRSAGEIELCELSESTADELHEGLESPLAASSFRVDGQPAWVLWDAHAALTSVEEVLGGESESQDDSRTLTRVELSLLTQVLAALVRPLCRALGGEASDFQPAGRVEELLSWQDAQQPDPHRLALEFRWTRGEESSPLRLWMPAPRNLPGAESEQDALEAVAPALPNHLERVPLELSARLGSVEIPLAQLLELEEGDVVPLSTRIGSPLELCLEDRTLAQASLGRQGQRLAVRLESGPPTDREAAENEGEPDE